MILDLEKLRLEMTATEALELIGRLSDAVIRSGRTLGGANSPYPVIVTRPGEVGRAAVINLHVK